MRTIFAVLVLVLLAGCSEQPAPKSETFSYDIDADRITVSGVSAGAYMAGQLHVAHSDLFRGAALVAGGPYWCAENSLKKGLGSCMHGGDVGMNRLLAYALEALAAGRIDALENLSDDKVWIFHGSGDVIMHPETSTAAASFYQQFIPPGGISIVDDVDVVHGLPTLTSGAPCDVFAEPYLNACNYDGAGEMLKSLYGRLEARRPARGELHVISQPGSDAAEMLDTAFLYAPESCASGESCGVHVAVHGCLQSSAYIGDVFARNAGYNEWADANNLLVLYPQVASSKIAPLNPNGCWDWWGYTNADYATRFGPQIAVIKAMLDALAGTTL